MFKGLRDTIHPLLKLPRTTTWLVFAVLLLCVIALISPVQLPVVLYKAALIAVAAVAGYWVDRVLFPYARPDGYLNRDWRYGTDEPERAVDFPVVDGYLVVFAASCLRRALVVTSVVIGLALGL